jgi:hypothetical protein
MESFLATRLFLHPASIVPAGDITKRVRMGIVQGIQQWSHEAQRRTTGRQTNVVH